MRKRPGKGIRGVVIMVITTTEYSISKHLLAVSHLYTTRVNVESSRLLDPFFWYFVRWYGFQ